MCKMCIYETVVSRFAFTLQSPELQVAAMYQLHVPSLPIKGFVVL